MESGQVKATDSLYSFSKQRFVDFLIKQNLRIRLNQLASEGRLNLFSQSSSVRLGNPFEFRFFSVRSSVNWRF